MDIDGKRYHTASELGMPQGGLLDLEAHELVVDGRRVPLTRLEYQLMHYLMPREGKAVSRADFLSDVWGYGYEGDGYVVEVAVSALRRRLGEGAAVVATVRGVGYRYRARLTAEPGLTRIARDVPPKA